MGRLGVAAPFIQGVGIGRHDANSITHSWQQQQQQETPVQRAVAHNMLRVSVVQRNGSCIIPPQVYLQPVPQFTPSLPFAPSIVGRR